MTVLEYQACKPFISPVPRVSGMHWRCKMKKSLLALVFMFVPALAQAEVKAKFTLAELAGITFKDGHSDRLPLASAYGVTLAIPFEGFALAVEGALVTPSTKFTPAYRLATGPAFSLNSTWSVGVAALYQYRPEYEDMPEAAQQVGLGVGPMAKITDSVAVGVGIGGWKVLDDGPWILAIQPAKIIFTLP